MAFIYEWLLFYSNWPERWVICQDLIWMNHLIKMIKDEARIKLEQLPKELSEKKKKTSPALNEKKERRLDMAILDCWASKCKDSKDLKGPWAQGSNQSNPMSSANGSSKDHSLCSDDLRSFWYFPVLNCRPWLLDSLKSERLIELIPMATMTLTYKKDNFILAIFYINCPVIMIHQCTKNSYHSTW